MPLSCECPDYSDCDKFYVDFPSDTILQKLFYNRRQCESCETSIRRGSLGSVHRLWGNPTGEELDRHPYWDEDKELDRPPVFLCERCTHQFMALAERGFCVLPHENMQKLCEQLQTGETDDDADSEYD